MPPRRSCFWDRLDYQSLKWSGFNATTAFLLLLPAPVGADGVAVFQCHHGVPASNPILDVLAFLAGFQCHHGVPASMLRMRAALPLVLFQCHHGVPASSTTSAGDSTSQSFNATTAFLLLATEWEDFKRKLGFNATTAFLLPGRLLCRRRADLVSMPPRRSCFS